MRDIARGRIAAVDSTRVPIIDVDWSVVNPSHRIAAIDSARIVVIDVDWIVMHTSHRVAAIGRARVVVVDVDWRSRAASLLTTIALRTSIAIAATCSVSYCHMDRVACGGIAGIHRTRIVIIGWRHRHSRLACSALTTISRRTGIAVSTSSTIRLRRVRAHAA